MTSATKTVPRKQRGDPWFDDGNIILLSEDSSVAFRVHRDFLSRHSEVFKSMFELPQPPTDDSESLEGCQVVRMFDQPIELSNLIKALYDGTGPSSDERTLDQFLYTAGILRLSTKYFIPRLRNEAIRQLVRTWSHTLRGHDEMIELALKSPLVDGKSYPYVHPLHVLNLARECDVQIIVPSVLYFLSLYPLADLLKADHPKLKLDHPSTPTCQIAPEDLQAYTLMFQHRIQLIFDFVRRTCGERAAAPGCQKDGRQRDSPCAKIFRGTSSRLSRTWNTRTGPLHFMVQVQDEILENPDICGPCRRGFRQDVTALREDTWRNLPIVVGLPGWAELEAIDLARTATN